MVDGPPPTVVLQYKSNLKKNWVKKKIFWGFSGDVEYNWGAKVAQKSRFFGCPNVRKLEYSPQFFFAKLFHRTNEGE